MKKRTINRLVLITYLLLSFGSGLLVTNYIHNWELENLGVIAYPVMAMTGNLRGVVLTFCIITGIFSILYSPMFCFWQGEGSLEMVVIIKKKK